MKIAVYCSANENIAPEYFRLTEELGRWLGREGHDLVFGGTDLGLMECIGRAVHEAGGRCIGMIPTLIEKSGRVSPYLDVVIPCNDLTDRKELMLSQCDVAVALPGGIGTVDEVMSMVAMATLGYHRKPVFLYNMMGFWDALIALLDDLQARGMIRGRWQQYIHVVDSLDSLTASIMAM